MAKFIKSMFHTEKRKSPRFDTEPDDEISGVIPPLYERRKLSLSRSGKLRHANRKRRSLTLDVYGDDTQKTETYKSVEYYVHTPSSTNELVNDKKQRRKGAVDDGSEKALNVNILDNDKFTQIQPVPHSPEEEIDKAFEIIDKS